MNSGWLTGWLVDFSSHVLYRGNRGGEGREIVLTEEVQNECTYSTWLQAVFKVKLHNVMKES